MSIRFSIIEVVHLPTGERARVDASAPYRYSRSQYHMRLAAINLLRSRLMVRRSNQLVATYELPEDTPCPSDLLAYRKPVTGF